MFCFAQIIRHWRDTTGRAAMPLAALTDVRNDVRNDIRNTMKARISMLATVVISLCFWGVPAAQAQTTAEFELTFNATWSASTHPTAYPGSAHFSGMIGATHLPEQHYWQVGQNASPGIRTMAELGSQEPLRTEIRNSGSAHHTIISGRVFFSPNTDSVTFTATSTHSALTLVSMIAPSPDWFVGVDALELRPNGQWIDEHTVRLFAYDAGTDSGTNFSSGNQATTPAVPIFAITRRPLGNTTPLGTFVIRRTSIQPPPLPDLSVENVSVSDLTPEPDAPFTVRATVRNRGDRATPASTLRYYRSTDRTITTGDTQFGTDLVGMLSAGGSSPESATVSIPNAGVYWVGACVNTVADETVTDNNCSAGVQVTVAEAPVPVPTQPDLLVDGVSVSTTTPAPDASFTVRATVRNRGDRAAPASTLRYYRSTDRGITRGDTELTTDPVVGLAPGRSSPEDALVSISDTGTYWIGVCVSTVPGETVTNNNCSDGLEVTVTDSPEPPVAPPTQPDLIVDDISVSDTTPEPGASFMINATVLNQGTAGFVVTRLRYYLSTDSTITPGDTELGSPSVVGRLAPDRSSEESASVSIPNAGAYWVGACVGSVSGEIVTANNCSTGVRVTVTAILPDLTVENVGVSDSTPEPGIAFTINATARNRGNADAVATMLRYYLSDDATISADDTVLATAAVGALAVGASSAQSTSVSIPGAGDYWVGACIDMASDETATANNCSTGVQVSVVAVLPDLTVENVGVSDLAPEAGASFTINATVRNTGNGASAATMLRYVHSDDDTITADDTELATESVEALAAGTFSVHNALVSIPDAGNYWVGACVDTVDDELATANNCSTGVQVGVTPRPDNSSDILPAIIQLLLLP